MNRNQSVDMDPNSKVVPPSLAEEAVNGMPAIEEEAKIYIRSKAYKFDYFEAKPTSP